MVGRIPVTDVSPVVECGRYPAKAVVGEPFPVTALVFREGHGELGAEVVLTDPDGVRRPPVPMRPDDGEPDRWRTVVAPDAPGSWTFEVHGWADPLASWRHDAGIKVPAGVDTELMFTEGALLLDRVAGQIGPEPEHRADSTVVSDAVHALRDTGRPVQARLAAGLSPELCRALARHPLREHLTPEGPFGLNVDRARALVGAWYELFPRSEGAHVAGDGTTVPGTLRTAARRLDAVAAMGFDVVYLPPVHPIGRVNRKGPNNTLEAGSDDVGSPWAIGSAEGGHDTVHPDLGTLEDLDAFVARAAELGLEVALDLALQCAPDHPWVAEHPEWFTTRADGTIAYAENPPKKYQDIYPVNFDNDPEGLRTEVLRVVRHWIAHGVRIFRVDNPHTKPVPFWEWLLEEVRRSDPDVVFLSEAFTRPAMMRTLAAVGFHQSYTYFTWHNTKAELEAYLPELAHATSHVLRPNLFVNTPDILHAYLQHGGPAAYKVRATLAATASPSWGVYAGFELCEHVPVRPGSEEYLDSEKYQVRVRDWEAAEREGRSLAPYLALLNRLRREHPALHELRNLHLHASDDDAVLVYSKQVTRPVPAVEPVETSGPGFDKLNQRPNPAVEPVETSGPGFDKLNQRPDTVIVVVNLDPHSVRETMVHLDLPALGMGWEDAFLAHDELTGQTWTWGRHDYVRLDPAREPAHVLTVRRPAP